MKKFILFLCLASATIFVSCSDDDESTPFTADETLIPGTWNLTALDINDGRTTTTFDGASISADYTSSGKDFDMELVLNDQTDPNTYTNSGSYTAVVTTTVLGQSETQEQTISDFLGAGEWSFEAPNRMIFSVEGEPQEMIITALTETTMVMEQRLDETFEEEFTGATVRTTGTLVVELSK